MTDAVFVTPDGEELNTAEAIQLLMRKNRDLDERVSELSDLLNILIGRCHRIESKL